MPLLRVSHVITGLPRGGAQRMLYYLLAGYDRSRFEMDVISLTEIGVVGEALRDIGVPVKALGMSRSIPNPLDLARLSLHFRRQNIDLVQTWLYHGDLIGAMTARPVGRPVIWNLRQSDLDPRTTKRGTLLTVKACARLSHIAPARIICCSEASRIVHGDLGYDAAKMTVIGNGVDFSAFSPDADARARVRQALGVAADDMLIGFAARYHPQKDHQTLIEAAAILVKTHPNAQFLLCGENIDNHNSALSSLIANHNLASRFHLLGERDDIAELTNAFDIATMSSSYGEGFPNVLAEAMACGVPCVATNVGDSAFIVGEAGTIVAARDPQALARGWAGIIDLDADERVALGAAARRRALANFKLETVIERYQTIYQDVAKQRNAA